MAWASSAVAISALRTLIFDGPVDKMADKDLIGRRDGTNKIFKTFEYRRVTSFMVASSPIGIYKNGTILPVSSIASDDTGTGSQGTGLIGLVTAPVSTDSLKAVYFYQWFQDSDLDGFLQNAASWLGFGTTYATLPDGLNAAALRFAAQEAYLAAAMKYSTRVSEVYKVEDGPAEDISKSIDSFRAMASDFMDKARDLRDDYYTRSGASKAPSFGFALGTIRDPQPRR